MILTLLSSKSIVLQNLGNRNNCSYSCGEISINLTSMNALKTHYQKRIKHEIYVSKENAPIPRAESTTSSRCCMYLWFKERILFRSKQGGDRKNESL